MFRILFLNYKSDIQNIFSQNHYLLTLRQFKYCLTLPSMSFGGGRLVDYRVPEILVTGTGGGSF